jgi:tol-pal system protein YbgF
MKKLAAAALVLSAACASAPDTTAPDYVPPAQQPGDQRVGELQTALTELMERLDVMNARIAKLESAPPPAPVIISAPASEPAAAAPAAPRPRPIPAEAAPAPQAPQAALVGAKIADDYRNALMLYGKNRVADSRRAFQDVFDSDPNGELADNALYWIGETYFAAGDFANAMRYYRRVTAEFADQNKAPDALFKTAIALERTGDLALARKTLQEVIDRYPYSTPAASAKQELTRIRF